MMELEDLPEGEEDVLRIVHKSLSDLAKERVARIDAERRLRAMIDENETLRREVSHLNFIADMFKNSP